MAWNFNGTSQYVTLGGNAVESLPDSDWTMAGWVQFSSRTGSGSDYVIASFGSEAYFAISVQQASATNANKLHLQIFEYADVDFNLYESGTSFASNTSATHIAARRSGTTFTIWVNGSQVGTSTNANVETVTIDGAGSVLIGIDADTSTGPFHGDLWEWAKWDRALSSDELATLAKKFAPIFFMDSLKWYVPMVREYTEIKTGIAVTNNSTTVSAHRGMIYPAKAIIGIPVSSTQNVAPPLLTNTPTFYSPTFVPGSVSLTAPLLTVTPTFYGPALSQSITAPLLTNSPTLHGPTLVKSPYNLTAPLLTNTPTFYGPTLAATYSLTAPLLSNPPTFYGPTFTASYSLTAPLLSITPTLYATTLVKSAYPLSPSLLTNTPSFYNPTFVPGAATLVAPLLSNAPTFYSAAFLGGSQSLAAPLLSNSPTFYGPTIGYKWTDVNGITTGAWTDVDFPFYES